MPLTNVLGNFFVIVLAGLGGWLALQGLVSVGIIATFISYGQNFINPLRQIGQHVQLHPGRAGRRGARLRDHRYAVRDRLTRRMRSAWKQSAGDVRFEHVDFRLPARHCRSSRT